MSAVTHAPRAKAALSRLSSRICGGSIYRKSLLPSLSISLHRGPIAISSGGEEIISGELLYDDDCLPSPGRANEEKDSIFNLVEKPTLASATSGVGGGVEPGLDGAQSFRAQQEEEGGGRGYGIEIEEPSLAGTSGVSLSAQTFIERVGRGEK